jgi:hypothetical protein
MEKVIEVKKCKDCSNKFEITDKDLEFYDKLSPIIDEIKYNLPIPNICPECREQQRTSFRNRRNLYKRKCDLTGKNIISMYSPDKLYKIYYNEDYESEIDNIDC